MSDVDTAAEMAVRNAVSERGFSLSAFGETVISADLI